MLHRKSHVIYMERRTVPGFPERLLNSICTPELPVPRNKDPFNQGYQDFFKKAPLVIYPSGMCTFQLSLAF
jgi:hypothetical protein